MSKYMDLFRTYLENIERSIAVAPTDRHRTILNGYLKHACFEFGSATDSIFTPDMTVANPRYTVKLGRGSTTVDVYDGEEPVKGFYAYVNSQLVMFCNENLFVNDWGLASRADLVRVVTGSQLITEGIEVDEPGANYAEFTHLAMFWPYDENGLLIGEHVYQLEEPTLEKVESHDMFTVEDRDAISAEVLARHS